MNPEVQPKDCDTCNVMESEETPLQQVAGHFIRSHLEYLKVLQAAVLLALAQKMGVIDG